MSRKAMTADEAAEVCRERDLRAALAIIDGSAEPVPMFPLVWRVIPKPAGPVPDGRTRAAKCRRQRWFNLLRGLIDAQLAGRVLIVETPDDPKWAWAFTSEIVP